MNKLIGRRTERSLRRMEKQELSLQQSLYAKDSLKAKLLFASSRIKYRQLIDRLHAPLDQSNSYPLKEYVSGLDSIQTAFRFANQAGVSITNISASRLQNIQLTSGQIQQVAGKLQQAADIQQFIKQRQQQLKDQLGQYDVEKQLLGMSKEAFYAQQQLIEYKEMINDKQKTEEKVLAGLSEMPAFNDFMQKHSYLAQLFSLPQDYASPTALIGLETRAQVQDLISQKIGSMPGNSSNGTDPSQYLQQQVQQARGEIDKLKDKLKALGNSGGSGDVTMPEFKPNNQRTRTFLHRIIYGFDLQTQPSTNLLPSTADMGITIGYKLNDRANIGIGGGYRLGLGAPINNISLSNQGVNIRSYFEWQAKGSWWLSGGWEYNYLQAFNKWSVLENPDIWQKSALIGFEKKYKVSKNRQGTVQLLFDALYRQHIPVSQPLIFRVGYQF